MGIVERVGWWMKTIIIVMLVGWAAWWAITHPTVIAGFIVTVVNAIKAFVTTLASGIF